MSKLTFSIILPIYNQKEQIPSIIKTYTRELSKMSRSFEIILVVNGSKDKSYDIALGYSRKFINIRVFNLRKGGWGRAIKYGIAQARGTYICYTNSARTDIKDLKKILHYAEINTNVVIKATRITRESFLRRLGSVIYNLECRLLLRIPVWDINGTPKIFPRDLVSRIKIVSDDDLIDAEILTKIFQLHIPVMEIPITYNERTSGVSTTNILSAIKMYWGIYKLARLYVKH